MEVYGLCASPNFPKFPRKFEEGDLNTTTQRKVNTYREGSNLR